MRTTVTLDDDLVKTAQEYTGIASKTALVRKALKTLIEQGKRNAEQSVAVPTLDDVFAALDRAQLPEDFMSDADRDLRPSEDRAASHLASLGGRAQGFPQIPRRPAAKAEK